MWALHCISLYGDLAEPLEIDCGWVAPRYLVGRLMLIIADQKHNVIFFPFHFSCSLPSPEDCCYCTGGDDLAEPLEMDIGSVAPASLTRGLRLSSRLRTLCGFFYCCFYILIILLGILNVGARLYSVVW